MNDQEFGQFVSVLDDVFLSTEALTERQQSRMRFMLGDLDGEQVTYNEAMFAIRRIAGEGMKFRPKPGEILDAVKKLRAADPSGKSCEVSETVASINWQRQFTATESMYGRDMAIAFFDEKGEREDLYPPALNRTATNKRGRKRLVDLHALDSDENPITGRRVSQ